MSGIDICLGETKDQQNNSVALYEANQTGIRGSNAAGRYTVNLSISLKLIMMIRETHQASIPASHIFHGISHFF